MQKKDGISLEIPIRAAIKKGKNRQSILYGSNDLAYANDRELSSTILIEGISAPINSPMHGRKYSWEGFMSGKYPL